jgi:hypothetical protein
MCFALPCCRWSGANSFLFLHFQARNLLRDHFRVGDKVLFYHSGDPKHMSALSAGKINAPGIAAVCVLIKVRGWRLRPLPAPLITNSQEAFPETGAPLNAKGEVRTRCLFRAIALTTLLCSHG